MWFRDKLKIILCTIIYRERERVCLHLVRQKSIEEQIVEKLIKKHTRAYMSITSLMRTLTATSTDGFPLLLLNLDEIVMWLVFAEGVSEQTAAMTSHTSTWFNRKGCCSLLHKQKFCKRDPRQATRQQLQRQMFMLQMQAKQKVFVKWINKFKPFNGCRINRMQNWAVTIPKPVIMTHTVIHKRLVTTKNANRQKQLLHL